MTSYQGLLNLQIKSSNYTHDVKEQELAFPLAQQYPFAQNDSCLVENNRYSLVIIGFYSKTIASCLKTTAASLNNGCTLCSGARSAQRTTTVTGCRRGSLSKPCSQPLSEHQSCLVT